MRLRIVSDGTAHGTTVIDENNEILEDVVEVIWQADIDTKVVAARLLIKGVMLDAVANSEVEH